MAENEPKVEEVVYAYITTRDRISEIEKEADAKIAPLKAAQVKREEWLGAKMAELGLKNIPTIYGTAYPALKESVTVADWDTVWSWIQEREAWNFLNKAINKTAVLEVMGDIHHDHRPNPPPPGVNYVALRTIQIRRS